MSPLRNPFVSPPCGRQLKLNRNGYSDPADAFEQPQMRRGKATVAIRQGHSKDHRHDLKQLLYILTVTDDGGVPVYFSTDNGDRNDDVTHIPTWDLLRQMTGTTDFLYIADCKLASAENLGHIAREGGRFITILPKNRSEPRAMYKTLLENPESLRWVLLYEVEDEHGVLRHRFKSLREEQLTGDGYRLLWIHSMGKAISDDASRMKSIQKTIDDLSELRDRLQSPRSRMRDRPRVAVFLKEASRIESLLCVYFIALLLQTLLEPELRRTMASQAIDSLPLYSETRDCKRPTARRVIDAMESISRHRLITEDGALQDLFTDPTPPQHQLIKLFGDETATYGRKNQS